MFSHDNNQEFVNQLAGSYGQMEAQMGTEMYQLFLDDFRAHQDRVRADTDTEKARANAIRIFSLSGMVLAAAAAVRIVRR
jgi:hypothetical protein